MNLSRILPILTISLLASPSFLFGEDLAEKVKALFESKCKECHHPDTKDDYPYLHKELDLAELIEEEMLVEGEPEESPIFRRVALEPTSKKRMPKSSGAEGDEGHRPPLTAEEQGLIRDWIAQLGGAAPEPAKTNTATASAKLMTGGADKPEKAEATEEKKEEAKKEEPKTPAVAASTSGNDDELPAGLDAAAKAQWIFAKRCAQCHQDVHAGDYPPELHGSVNLASLFSGGAKPGTSYAESIIDRVMRDDSDRMPKSKGKEHDKGYRAPLSDAEKAALKEWMAAGKPAEVRREFISQNDVIEAIYQDLDKATETQRKFYRYLTLTNLHNQADENGVALIPDDSLDSHRAAVGKLINSLSMNAKVVAPTAIDEARTIYRIDLRDYKWTIAQWDEVVAFYPYGIVGVDGRKEQLIERHTGARLAFLRADWFVFAASQPPLYDKIMDKLLGFEASGKDDDILAKLDKALGVDRFHNLREGQAIRAGFKRSGVSGANRLIERHEIGSWQGAYWVSYDFTPQAANRTQDLTLAPLGPVGAGLSHDSDRVFHHDGGEMVYNLPNGLQGYMLTTHDGKRLDRAPIEIVQDKNRPDKVILNGVSCMACHDKGMKAAEAAPIPRNTRETIEDEIRPIVEKAGILDFSERKLLEKLYPEPAVLQAAVKEDYDRFIAAEAEATGGLSGGGDEFVYGLYKEFRSEVTARKLAAELGIEYDELIKRLQEESHRSETLSVIVASLELGLSIERDSFLREYISIVYALGYELKSFTPLGYEEFGGQKYADLVANSDQYLQFIATEGKPLSASKTILTTSTASTEGLATESVLLPGGGKLRLSIQPNLKVGDQARLEVVATDDIHALVYHFSADQHVTELFPGNSGKRAALSKNKKLTITWTTTAPGGAEHVIVFASKSELKTIAKGEVAGEFVVYEKDKLLSSRGVPTGIKVSESDAGIGTPAQVTKARIGYQLKE